MTGAPPGPRWGFALRVTALPVALAFCGCASAADPDCVGPSCGPVPTSSGGSGAGTAAGTGGMTPTGEEGNEQSDQGDRGEDGATTGDGPAVCGNRRIEGDEACDDGNQDPGDGCEADCTLTPGAASIVTGNAHSCAVLHDGSLRCWGRGREGQLGYGNPDPLGDDEGAGAGGPVPLPEPVIAVAAGGLHTCAIVESGQVYCWGLGQFGQLGYGNTDNVGDNETVMDVGAVEVGGSAVAIAAGGFHTCAVLDSGAIRCWGDNSRGELGYGGTEPIGDNESPASGGRVVNVGGASVLELSAGQAHTCALLQGGDVMCWGRGASGRLGTGSPADIGDDESPSAVDLGGVATSIAAGQDFTCALLDDGSVRCFGNGGQGQLGLANTEDIGDDETPSSVAAINLGGAAQQIAAGGSHACARLTGGKVRCWGRASFGQLGYGNTDTVGDDEAPATVGDVDVGGAAIDLQAGASHTCIRSMATGVRCFGLGAEGQLGYGNTRNIGDDEAPSSAGDLPLP